MDTCPVAGFVRPRAARPARSSIPRHPAARAARVMPSEDWQLAALKAFRDLLNVRAAALAIAKRATGLLWRTLNGGPIVSARTIPPPRSY
jgi:hypothetical protein